MSSHLNAIYVSRVFI